jgi:pimeloyl-ACP methyl ester carboxylesterase
MRELFVETRWGRLAATEAAPPPGVETRAHAVMTGGFLIGKEMWVPAMLRLARQGYHVCAYDHLGMAASGGPDEAEAYTLDALADDLLVVAGEIAGTRSVHVLGSCFGGFVARTAVLRAPERARSLTLLSSGPSMAESTDPGFAGRMASIVSADGHAGIGKLVTDWLAEQPGRPGRAFDVFQRNLDGTTLGHLLGFPRSVDEAVFPEEALRALDIPKLVVYGVHDNVWIPPVQEAMGQRIGARTVAVDNAKHAPLLDRPATTATVLQDFLDQAEDVATVDRGRAQV